MFGVRLWTAISLMENFGSLKESRGIEIFKKDSSKFHLMPNLLELCHFNQTVRKLNCLKN